MKKSIIAFAATAILAAPSFAQEVGATPSCEAGAPSANIETIVVQVNGMVCDFCARAVEKVFSKRDEVNDVDVDLDASTITVKTSDCMKLDDETIEKLVKKSGYAFVSLERSSGA